jgi:hypothetical protein
MAKKAMSLSITELGAAVEKAVKAERAKGTRFDPQLHIKPGVIFGMQLAKEATFEEANALAERLTKQVSATAKRAGITALTPVVLSMKKQITVGFVDPGRNPLVLE